MDRQLVRVYELKLDLLRLGYKGFQVDAIQQGVIGDALPEEISAARRKELIATLEKYAYFAGRYRVSHGGRYGADT